MSQVPGAILIHYDAKYIREIIIVVEMCMQVKLIGYRINAEY